MYKRYRKNLENFLVSSKNSLRVSRRGQITVFIIIGIFILLVIAGLLFMKNSFEKEDVKSKEDKIVDSAQLGGDVQNYIENCIERTGEDALVYIGEQGGYYDLPEVYDPEFNLPYYFYENEDYFISLEELEKQLSAYMDEHLFFCLENFESFKDKGYEIEQGVINTETKVVSGKVIFNVNFPVNVVKGSVGKELLVFETDIQSRLETILEISKQLIDGVVERPFAINLGQISDLSLDNDLMIELSDLNEDVYFTIVDKNTLGDKEIYDFNFVVRYQFGEDDDDDEVVIEDDTDFDDEEPLFEEDDDEEIFEE